ncbi:hypothetical protein [Streptomyces sp. NPDC001380]|uniref:hypothetical protein n=1 Tax=Streptomyces sp. NPDC001380 TaxID=3364566 RepID=UPI003689DCCC
MVNDETAPLPHGAGPAYGAPPAAPVFVDASGRRRRRVSRLGRLLAVPAAAYVALLASTVLGGPTVDTPLLPAPPRQPVRHATVDSAPSAEPTRTQGPRRSATVRPAAPAGTGATGAGAAASARPAPVTTTRTGAASPRPAPATATSTAAPAPSPAAPSPTSHGRSSTAPGATRKPAHP